LRWALERPDGWGYGLLGEAMMERLRLAFLYRKPGGEMTRSVPTQIHDLMRSWLARKLPASFATS
jgi:hypothetical protein